MTGATRPPRGIPCREEAGPDCRPADRPARSRRPKARRHRRASRSPRSTGRCAATSGNCAFEFLSSTMVRSATRCATSSPWKTSGTWRRGGLSNRPAANSVRRMRCTMSSTRATGTSPLATASLSAPAKKVDVGISMSRPAMAAFAVLCVAPQSERTKPWKPEILLQNLVEQVAVLAGVVAVHQVVGAHHGSRAGLLHGDLERQQVGLAHGALVDLDVDDVAAGLLVVERVVLDVADDALSLQAPSSAAPTILPGQDRIFAVVFEVAAVARLAGQVHAAAERHVVALVAQLRGRSARRIRGPASRSQLAASAMRRAAPWSSGR